MNSNEFKVIFHHFIFLLIPFTFSLHFLLYSPRTKETATIGSFGGEIMFAFSI